MIKKTDRIGKIQKLYFWRTYEGQEIDLIIQQDQKLNCFEIKYNKDKKKIKIPSEFKDKYTKYSFDVINKVNFVDFL